MSNPADKDIESGEEEKSNVVENVQAVMDNVGAAVSPAGIKVEEESHVVAQASDDVEAGTEAATSVIDIDQSQANSVIDIDQSQATSVIEIDQSQANSVIEIDQSQANSVIEIDQSQANSVIEIDQSQATSVVDQSQAMPGGEEEEKMPDPEDAIPESATEKTPEDIQDGGKHAPSGEATPGAVPVAGPDAADQKEQQALASPPKLTKQRSNVSEGAKINSRKKKKKEMNPDFKDVQETGKWGEISKMEVYIVIAVISILVIVAVVVVVVVVLVVNKKDDGGNKAVDTPATPAPTVSTPAPTALTPAEELAAVFAALETSSVTAPLLSVLPRDVESYRGLNEDPRQPANVRALSWLLHVDEFNSARDAPIRFSLATLYYAMGGFKWTERTNWLASGVDLCDWYGTRCDIRSGDLADLLLDDNNLQGSIPDELSLLVDTRAIWLRDNKVTGTIPGEVFGALPSLSILYLQNNMLTGTIPLSIRDNGVLQTLFVEGNRLTGQWPEEFCQVEYGDDMAAFNEFRIDCYDAITGEGIQCGCCGPNECF